ncbi:MAG TPA: cytochrome c oxidase subunit 3 [Acidimicrobiales bacterium]|jgi:heme/copper-type cytochrome/quinol oxidase subunit 3|nr:cytochrome c oxidase subunit 3 [Acidimicrobiales bacterium]
MASSMLALPAAGTTGAGVEGRRGILPLGVTIVGAGGLMVMGGLVAAYLALKNGVRGVDWPPEDTSFDNYTATTLSLTVLMAMITIEWAAYAIRKDFRGQALFAFGLTAALAIAHLNGLGYLINGFEFGVADSAYAAVVHALTLVPFLIGAIAVGAVVLVGLRAVGHQLSLANYALMRAAANAWHIAAIAWVIAYYTVYITK